MFSALNGSTLTYFLADQGYQPNPRGGQYPPDWVELFYKHFPSFNDSLMEHGIVSDKVYQQALERAPKLVLKGEYLAHDLSHLDMFLERNGDFLGEEDAERDEDVERERDDRDR